MENKKTPSEINLIDLLAAVWSWLVRGVLALFTLIGQLLQLLYRQKILVICVVLLALAISQYLARPSARKYEVGAMAILHGTAASRVIQVGNQLVQSSSEFQVTSLSNKLGMPDSVAAKFQGLWFYNVIDYLNDTTPDKVDFGSSHALTDTLNVVMQDHIYIRFRVLGTNHADEIGNAIVNYINNNPVIKSEYETQREMWRQEIAIAEVEKKRLDSLSRKKYFESDPPNIKLENNRLMVGNQSTQLFYGDMLHLQRVISATEMKYANARAPVVVPSGFIINPEPLNGRMKNGLKGLFIGLALSIVLGFVVENYKRWLRFLAQK